MSKKKQPILLLAAGDDSEKIIEIMNSISEKLEIPSPNDLFLVKNTCEDAINSLDQHDFYIVRSDKNNKKCFSKRFLDLTSNKSNISMEISDNNGVFYHPKRRLLEVNYSFFLKEHKKIIDLIRFIVHKPIIYVSYGNDDDNQTYEKTINKISEAINDFFPNIQIISDRHNKGIQSGGIVSEFIDRIKKSNNLIIILNNKYFESLWCMDEFSGFIEHSDKDIEKIKKRMYLIYQESATDLFKDSASFQYRYKYWYEKLLENTQKICSGAPNKASLDELVSLIKIVRDVLPFFEENIKDIKAFQEVELTSQSYLTIISWIIIFN